MVFKHVKQKQISFGYCDTASGQRVYPPQAPTSPQPEMSGAEDLLPDQRPPKQPKPFGLDGSVDTVDLKLTSYPPLGQPTVISRSDEAFVFTVLAEVQQSAEELLDCLELQVWHNHGGEYDWSELPLDAASGDAYESLFTITSQAQGNAKSYQSCFSAELSGLPKHCHAVKFTMRYRFSSKDEWNWIKDTTGQQDGELLYHSPHLDLAKHGAHELSQFFSNMSNSISITSEAPETSDTLLYSLTSSIAPAKDEDSGYQYHKLGVPTQMSKWFALVRLWSPWLAPRQGRADHFELDKDGILVTFLRDDGFHVVCLAVSGVEEMVTTLITEDNQLVIKGRNDLEEAGTARVLVAVAESFEAANAAVMYHARKVLRSYGASPVDEETVKLMDEKMKPEWMEEWYDGLTYCTWNGLGQDLTDQKIYDALDELKKNDITITNLIIDDNWQSLSKGESQFTRAWNSFEANKDGFPDGMKATTTEIRKRHPNVKHIAVWHAILGYWGGVSPEGEIADKYKVIEVEKEPGVAGGKFHVVAAEDAQRMYDDFYSFLAASGVDSVKTDAQFFLDMLLHAPDRRDLVREYQDAWTISHLRHFNARAISCMSQAPQILFYEQLPTNKPRLLVRNSDDFFPEVEASHPWHIFCNAHNSLLTQHLNVLPDWDMFQTSHPWAAFHTAARCVSGGPIYFTDEPGKHDIDLINAMTAKTVRDGRSIILRPHTVGKAMDVYNPYEAQALVKIGTYVGFAKTGTSILGIFNVTQNPISEVIPLDSFPGTEKGEYIVSSFVSGEVSPPMHQGSKPKKSLIHHCLEKRGWDVLTAHPLRSFTIAKKPVQIANLGLLGKMTGPAAITGYDVYVESNGHLRVWTSLKALGVLGLFISDLDERKVEEDFMIMILGEPIPKDCVRVSEKVCAKDGKVLEIDVEEAWKRRGGGGYSNEVSVEVFMH